MTARQIEQALLTAAPEDRISLAARLIAIALADDDVLAPRLDLDREPEAKRAGDP